jgi:hypothetical protein
VGLVHLDANTAAYETLYTVQDAAGRPLTGVYGGSWGILAPALGAKR